MNSRDIDPVTAPRTSPGASAPHLVDSPEGRSGSRWRRALARATFPASVETMVLGASLYWASTANTAFFGAALAGRNAADPASWTFGMAIFLLLVALNAALVLLVANRWTVKPLLAAMTILAACVSYFIGEFGVYLDPSMLRNVLHTDMAEAGELMSWKLFAHLAVYAGLPLALLSRVRVTSRGWLKAIGVRASVLVLFAVVGAGALWAVFQPFSSLMRNHKEVRYLITPANVLWSSASALAGEARDAAGPRQAIGLDATPGNSWAARQKPLVVLLVVGETARAANWGLNGYQRQTTPELAGLPVVNMPNVVSCGTNTEVSLPCMFAPVGRRDYHESQIRAQESLLHVLARAGVAVHWRDNQSGCKGVCEGLPSDTVSSLRPSGLCEGDRCLDEGLIADLDERLKDARGTQLWVLHMLGNHGPAYFRRYPNAFERFRPDCRDEDLRRCSAQEVVNAYDNALLYTDHVLATAIARLRAHEQEVDSALVYVSDHGESLGEQGLFLHGVPYAISPDVQTHVPMIFWESGGFDRAAGLAPGCLRAELRREAGVTLTHDNLFHTLLGLLDVRTKLYEPSLDLSGACRGS